MMIRVGWYRSVNNIQNAFAMNTFANELLKRRAGPGRVPARDDRRLEEMDLSKDGVEDHWNYGDRSSNGRSCR